MTNQVGVLIESAFGEAFSKKEQLNKDWTALSFFLGSKLPESTLPISIQRVGRLDILIRCMEDTFHSHKTIFSAEYLMMFSELWVCETYEFMRVMKARELYPDKKHEIDEVYNQLKLLRIPLDKHEIASDRKIKEPIKLIKHPIREGDTPYEYNSNDSLRSHIMPRSFSSIGSAIWQVTDIKTSQSYWIERRSLSNKLLKLKTA